MSEPVIIGDATLYCADNSDVFDSLPQVDVTISDPPYAEKTHAGARTGSGGATC